MPKCDDICRGTGRTVVTYPKFEDPWDELSRADREKWFDKVKAEATKKEKELKKAAKRDADDICRIGSKDAACKCTKGEYKYIEDFVGEQVGEAAYLYAGWRYKGVCEMNPPEEKEKPEEKKK